MSEKEDAPSGRYMDEDAAAAAADLVGRAGAAQLSLGYEDDEDADIGERSPTVWYAHAQYRGHRVMANDQRGPVEALEELARQLLTGARCRCGRLVALGEGGAEARPGLMADGSRWTLEEIQAAGQCRWRRLGKRWEPSCDAPPLTPRRGEGTAFWPAGRKPT